MVHQRHYLLRRNKFIDETKSSLYLCFGYACSFLTTFRDSAIQFPIEKISRLSDASLSIIIRQRWYDGCCTFRNRFRVIPEGYFVQKIMENCTLTKLTKQPVVSISWKLWWICHIFTCQITKIPDDRLLLRLRSRRFHSGGERTPGNIYLPVISPDKLLQIVHPCPWAACTFGGASKRLVTYFWHVSLQISFW